MQALPWRWFCQLPLVVTIHHRDHLFCLLDLRGYCDGIYQLCYHQDGYTTMERVPLVDLLFCRSVRLSIRGLQLISLRTFAGRQMDALLCMFSKLTIVAAVAVSALVNLSPVLAQQLDQTASPAAGLARPRPVATAHRVTETLSIDGALNTWWSRFPLRRAALSYTQCIDAPAGGSGVAWPRLCDAKSLR